MGQLHCKVGTCAPWQALQRTGGRGGRRKRTARHLGARRAARDCPAAAARGGRSSICGGGGRVGAVPGRAKGLHLRSQQHLVLCCCDLGYSGDDGGPCAACEAGTYKGAVGDAACASCPPHLHSAAASRASLQPRLQRPGRRRMRGVRGRHLQGGGGRCAVRCVRRRQVPHHDRGDHRCCVCAVRRCPSLVAHVGSVFAKFQIAFSTRYHSNRAGCSCASAHFIPRLPCGAPPAAPSCLPLSLMHFA